MKKKIFPVLLIIAALILIGFMVSQAAFPPNQTIGWNTMPLYKYLRIISGADGTKYFEIEADDTSNHSIKTSDLYNVVSSGKFNTMPLIGTDYLNHVLNGQDVITVDANATADITGVLYNTVQEAVTYVASQTGKWVIHVIPGTYPENVVINVPATVDLALMGKGGYSALNDDTMAKIDAAAATSAALTISNGGGDVHIDSIYFSGTLNNNINLVEVATTASTSFTNNVFVDTSAGNTHTLLNISNGSIIGCFLTNNLFYGDKTTSTITGISIGNGFGISSLFSVLYNCDVGITTNATGVYAFGQDFFTQNGTNIAGAGTIAYKTDTYPANIGDASNPVTNGYFTNLYITNLGATGSRVTKGWFTDIESTNMPAVGGVSLTTTFVDAAGDTMSGNLNFLTGYYPVLNYGAADQNAYVFKVDLTTDKGIYWDNANGRFVVEDSLSLGTEYLLAGGLTDGANFLIKWSGSVVSFRNGSDTGAVSLSASTISGSSITASGTNGFTAADETGMRTAGDNLYIYGDYGNAYTTQNLWFGYGSSTYGSGTNTARFDLSRGHLNEYACSFLDEFWAAMQPQWAARTHTGAGNSAQSISGGWWRIITGASDNNEESYDWNDIYQFVNTDKPSFEIILTPEDFAHSAFFFGLVGASVNDHVWITHDSNVDAYWYLKTSKDGAAESSDASAAVGGTAEVKLRFTFITTTSVEWFLNDVSQGTLSTAANIPTAVMQPIIQIYTREANTNYVNVDKVEIWTAR